MLTISQNPAPKRRRSLWAALGVLLALSAVTGAIVITRADPAPHRHLCCKPPPDTRTLDGVPRRWRTAVVHGDTRAAWKLLTPEAQQRYGSPRGLRRALTALTPKPRGPATWRRVDESSQGRDTPSEFVYVLVEDKNLRPAGAVIVHSMANGSGDGRVDPGMAATVRILDPAPYATVDPRPRMRVAMSSAPDYSAVRARGQTIGAVGAIRDADGFDAPFDEALKPGPALIVAVARTGGRFRAYGSVIVTVR